MLYDDSDEEGIDEDKIPKYLYKQNYSKVPEIPCLNKEIDQICLWKVHGLIKPKMFVIKGWSDCKKAKLSIEDSWNVADFFLFVSERQRLWERRKLCYKEPWSASIIFQKYSWCNNYRELDRGTQYFHLHIIKLFNKYKNISYYSWMRKVLFASYVYRQSNRIQSFIDIGYIPEETNIQNFINKMMKFKENGKIFFTGAHQTTNYKSCEKAILNILNNDNKILHTICNELCNAKKFKECIFIIKKLPNVGKFFAWQMFCDLYESKCFYLIPESYCELGPGAIGK